VEQPGKLAQFLVGVAGHFRVGEEASFPWHDTDRGIWYALLVVEDGRIRRYGFTSASDGKEALCDALDALSPGDEALLLGIWTGQYRTDLFVLEPAAARDFIRGSKKLDRFEHLGEIIEVELVRRRGSPYLSYSYRGAEGQSVHTGTSRREEVAALLEYFALKGVAVRERREAEGTAGGPPRTAVSPERRQKPRRK
jgi:hypothetical protein